MKTLYFDLYMGAAGDMLTAALIELLPDRDAFIKKLNGIGLVGVTYELERVEKRGISASQMTVRINGETEEEHEHHEHHHSHNTLEDIRRIVSGLSLKDKVKTDVMAVYEIIANAEAEAHGTTVGDVHFHEVGTADAVADIAAVCMLIDELSPERIIASPVNTGCGTVKCAHGVLPVPAPATALILNGIPCYSGDIKSELCTPTGAALIKYFADEYGALPTIVAEKIGFGAGKKDFETANCVRVISGETETAEDTVCELSFNIDDMTAEQIAFAGEVFLREGALDVYKCPVYMKKNRLGTRMDILCRRELREKMIALIFKNTTTLGIREAEYKRSVLERNIKTVKTEFGEIRVKHSNGYGVMRYKAESDDVIKAAKENNLSYFEILSAVEKDGKNDEH